MSKYSLKDVFYKKASILSEMAIITQSNFIERIINVVENKPQIAGISSSELEMLKQKSPNSDLNKLEDSIAKEILRCVYKTGLLNLSGKENKKARKQAEVLIIKQLRKHNNIDITPIEFKRCLPLYDKIADYVETAADVDLSDCIRIADMYMKDIYPNSLEDEKREIEKGEFSFGTIVTRTGYYKKYLRDYERRAGSSDIYLAHESDDWKVVFPCTPKSFRQFAIKNSKSKSSSARELSWCTLKPETWFTYMERQFLFIAIYKKAKPGDRLSLVSLKVEFDGTINIEDSCCRNNDHLNDETLGRFISAQMIQDIQDASVQLTMLGFGEADMENTVEQRYNNLSRRVREISELRNVPAIKNIMTKYCLAFKRGVFDGGKILVDNNQGFTTAELTDLLVEFLSDLLFNNWTDIDGGESGWEIPGIERFLDPSKLGLKLIDKFKEKMLDPRAHPQYLITLLSLDFESLRDFSNEEIKDSIKIALETNNDYNFHRTLSLLLRSEHFKNLIELDKIEAQEEISSPVAKEIIETIVRSKGNINFTSSKNYELFRYLNWDRDRSTGSSMPEAPRMLGYFYAKNTERFGEITNESDCDNKIKIALFNAALDDVFGRANASVRLPGIDSKEFDDLIDNLFLDFDLFNRYFDLYSKKTLQNLFVFASKEMSDDYSQNLVNLKNQEFPMIFEKIAESIKDNDATLSYAYSINASIYKKYITNRVLDILADNFVKDFDSYAQRIFSTDRADKKNKLLFEVAKKLDIDNKNKLFYKVLKIINRQRQDKISLIRNSFIRRSSSDSELKDFISYIFNSSDKFDFKFDSATLIQKSIRDKSVKDDIGEEILRGCLNSHSYYNTRTILQSLSRERVTSKVVVQLLEQYINNIAKLHDINFICEDIFDYVTSVFNESNIPFPKETLSKLILSRTSSYSHAKDYDSIIENFISVPREVSGRDLAVIRDTLVKIFRKNKSGNYYNNPKMKSFVVEKIKEMPQVARGHMQLAFPELASQLRARTPEEEAQQAARNETLLKQYVKLLMS